MKVKVRRFRRHDVIKAGNTVKAAQRITLRKCYPKRLIEAFCEQNNPKNFLRRARERQFHVAESGKRIVGVIALKSNQIRTFYVHPSWQTRGIGRMLFEQVKREAQRKGYRTLKVSSSLYAVPIYQSLGFRVVKRTRKRMGEIPYSAILMKQSI